MQPAGRPAKPSRTDVRRPASEGTIGTPQFLTSLAASSPAMRPKTVPIAMPKPAR